MSINQTQLYDTLQSLTQRPDVQAEFIYGFLDAYGFAKSTITQVKNGGARNVAKVAGDVALKGQLYFRAIPAGENVHEAVESLKGSDVIKAQKIRFVIVTNFNELVAYDLKADERMETLFTELHQQYTFFLPLAGLEKSYTHTESVADVKAAEKMGRLFDLIRERNQISTADEVHALNVFLTRLLFCFFAEDTGIFAKNQFTDVIKSTTREDGEDLAEFLGKLFSVLNEPDNSSLRKSLPAHLTAFPYVNGGLFEKETPIPVFGAKSRRLLLECSTLDWSQINPDIFGSMFQAVIDEDQRGTLGQHYTSVSNIMKVIKPLFLDKLHAELERSRGSTKKLQALLERVSSIKVFDPACGSGNFLIIAYKELRRFEMEVFRALNEVSQQNVIFMTGIKLSQFYGIEIDDFAHEIALLSLWLAEHQMNNEFEAAFGYAEPILPLKSGGNICLGNSVRIDWNEVLLSSEGHETYVIGNPPYVGASIQSESQKEDIDFVFRSIHSHRKVDYLACWLVKAAKYINKNSFFSFVVTNSVNQGIQVEIIWPVIFDMGLEIFFAHKSFPWSNNARGNAGVVVSIIGVRHASDGEKYIFDGALKREAKNINAYLVDAENVFVSNRNSPPPGVDRIVFGNKPIDYGLLILSDQEKNDLLVGHPEAITIIKRLYGSQEFIKGIDRWCLWIEDDQIDLALSIPSVRSRIDSVRSARKCGTSVAKACANRPHQFCMTRRPVDSMILIPEVSTERRDYIPIGFLGRDSIPTNKALVIFDASIYTFGLINSRIHMVWVKTVTGRLGNGISYSAGVCYNSFPWPEADIVQRKNIEHLAEDVLMVREGYPDKTMASLYDPEGMPDDLKFAHKKLDDAVDRLYRARPFRDDDERLEHLFARYAILAEQECQQQAAEAVTKKTRKPRAAKTVTAEKL
ncbi:class I SAM-dependent DNA methyltransferase [Stutzerimonas stutzeri]|uniref:class I SAM-dependent DNA methyltransferase n=1 Tax=Stutzerimonas stutzeri TaxID=316 RepID=UPI0002FEDADC|nr:DNA methyltransferase [Stutzerimonas stutzeri]